MKMHSATEYWAYVKENPYLIAAVMFAAVAVGAFVSGHLFIGLLSVAGAGLAGSVLLKDGLPEQKGDEDDLTGI